MKSSKAKKAGFTMVEVLVVIVITGTALSMMPAMTKSKGRQGDLMVCSRNLRKIGVALHTYAADNNGHLPPMVAPRDNATQDIHLWGGGENVHLGKLLPDYISYKKGRKLLFCPRAEEWVQITSGFCTPGEPRPYDPWSTPREGTTSYSYHDRLGVDGTRHGAPIILSNFEPTEPLTADATYFKWHETGWNVLYMDGSVKYVESEEYWPGGANQELMWLIFGSTYHRGHEQHPAYCN